MWNLRPIKWLANISHAHVSAKNSFSISAYLCSTVLKIMKCEQQVSILPVVVFVATQHLIHNNEDASADTIVMDLELKSANTGLELTISNDFYWAASHIH